MEGGVKEKRREGEGGKRRRDWGLEGLCPIGSNGEGGNWAGSKWHLGWVSWEVSLHGRAPEQRGGVEHRAPHSEWTEARGRVAVAEETESP